MTRSRLIKLAFILLLVAPHQTKALVSFSFRKKGLRHSHKVSRFANLHNKILHPTTSTLAVQPNSNGGSSSADSSTGASVRFSGADGLTTTTTNPIDAFLSVLASDIVSIALGLLGLLVIVGHRLQLLDDNAAAENLALQTRTDLLAVFACGSVLLNGVTKLDVTAAMAESVILEGVTLEEPEIMSFSNDGTLQDTWSISILWALESLLVATPATTAVLLEQGDKSTDTRARWSILGRSGIVSTSMTVPESTPILDRVSSAGNINETYLPTLQALPGKREFPYLPINAQLALLIPVGVPTDDGRPTRILVLGSNRAKSFTPRDVAWCRIIADRICN